MGGLTNLRRILEVIVCGGRWQDAACVIEVRNIKQLADYLDTAYAALILVSAYIVQVQSGILKPT